MFYGRFGSLTLVNLTKMALNSNENVLRNFYRFITTIEDGYRQTLLSLLIFFLFFAVNNL